MILESVYKSYDDGAYISFGYEKTISLGGRKSDIYKLTIYPHISQNDWFTLNVSHMSVEQNINKIKNWPNPIPLHIREDAINLLIEKFV